MRKLKISFITFSVLAAALCSSAVLAQGPQTKQANGADHRSAVATFVQSLVDVANKEPGTIGDQIKAIAQAQNDTANNEADSLDKIQNRSKVKTFLIGTDYKNIGQLRSEMVKTAARIDQLKKLLESDLTLEDKAALQTQIQTLEQEQQKIDDFLKANESKFSLFGWLVKLFSK